MSELEVAAGERGVIRVFALMAKPRDMTAETMARALGIDRVDMTGVELVPLADLEGVGLAGYLTEGLGVAPEALGGGTLEGIGETVAIVHSPAFGGRALTLDPRPPLQLAAVYREMEGTPGDLMASPSAAALPGAGPVAPPAEEDGGASRWPWLLGIGVAVGFVVAFLLVLLGGRA